MAPEAVPVLTYHSLDETGSVLSTPPAFFQAQMRSLRARGFSAVRLGDVLDAWDGRAARPPRPVALTFDDGFRSVCDSAAPVLEELGFRATIFAVAGHCGGRNDWPSQPPDAPLQPLLSTSELRGLADRGFEIGAHGVTHAPLDRLDAAAAEQEIAGSKRKLEDVLGLPVTLFAYPYGVASPAVRELVRAQYRAACSAELRLARPSDDRHWLGRIDMYYFRDPALFRLFGTPLGRAYLGLRRVGRLARGAVTGRP